MKRSSSLIYIGLFLCVWIFLLIGIYEKGKLPGALIYSEIPEQTIRFLDILGEKMDLFVRYNPDIRPKDWQNKNNYGEDPRTGLKKVEDDYFIVYFNGNRREEERALKTLALAREAIPELEALMGVYFYPEQVNGRKLPIYLAEAAGQYESLVNLLLGRTSGKTSNSIGMYISQYSRMGNLTLGIVLHPTIWKPSQTAKETIWHEMNHYVYFTAIEYDKTVRPYMWVYEGLADYFSKTTPTVLSESQQQQCYTYSLSGAFPDYQANYWGGESVYRYLEQDYGQEPLKSFVRYTYVSTVEEALLQATGKDVTVVEEGWKMSLGMMEGGL